jgi:hypothetical protein
MIGYLNLASVTCSHSKLRTFPLASSLSPNPPFLAFLSPPLNPPSPHPPRAPPPLPFPEFPPAPWHMNPFSNHMLPSLFPMSSIQLPILTFKPTYYHLSSLTTNRMLMASPPIFHLARSLFYSWVLLESFSSKGTPLQHSWLLRFLPSVFTWLFRMLRFHFSWYFLRALSVYIHHVFNVYLTCMLSVYLIFLLLSLCTNMWRRSRGPCSCSNCTSEELREELR